MPSARFELVEEEAQAERIRATPEVAPITGPFTQQSHHGGLVSASRSISTDESLVRFVSLAAQMSFTALQHPLSFRGQLG